MTTNVQKHSLSDIAEEKESVIKKVLDKIEQKKSWADMSEEKDVLDEIEQEKSWVEVVNKNNDQKVEIVEKKEQKVEIEANIEVEKFEDKILNCVKCKTDFLFDIREQKYFKENNYEPRKLCFHCKNDNEDKKKFEGLIIDKPYEFFCKICKRKDVMYVCELIFFKQQGYDKRNKCKDCKNKKQNKKTLKK